MTENKLKFLKNMKILTSALAIISTIYSALYIIASASISFANSMDWGEASLSSEEIADMNSAIPYYLLLVIQVFYLINNIISLTLTIAGLVISSVIAVLSILAIFNLFKLKSANEEEQ